MKPSFLIFTGVLFCNMLLAQVQNGPTRYDAFIKNSKIQWAGYLSTEMKSCNEEVKNDILDHFIKGTLKAYQPIQYRWPDALKLIRIDKLQIDTMHHIDLNITSNRTNANLSIDEILYIQNNKLYSYIPWVSMRSPIVTPAGTYLGEARIFSTSINHKNRKRSYRKKDFLCRSIQFFNLDSLTMDNKLKEFYGQNIIGTLWPVWLKSGQVYFAKDSSKAIVNTGGNGFKSNIIINVPLYNMYGELIGNKTMYENYNEESFNKIAIEQEWYYCKKGNIFYTKIIQIYLCSDAFSKDPNNVILKDGYHAILKIEL